MSPPKTSASASVTASGNPAASAAANSDDSISPARSVSARVVGGRLALSRRSRFRRAAIDSNRRRRRESAAPARRRRRRSRPAAGVRAATDRAAARRDRCAGIPRASASTTGAREQAADRVAALHALLAPVARRPVAGFAIAGSGSARAMLRTESVSSAVSGVMPKAATPARPSTTIASAWPRRKRDARPRATIARMRLR